MKEVIMHKKDGVITNEQVVVKAIKDLPDGTYRLEFHTRKQRSMQQNKYYWSVVVDMVREGLVEVGYDEMKDNNEVHEFLKGRFLHKEIVNKQTGELLQIPVSTTDLTTQTFQEYIDGIVKWSAEYLGINIPEPNSQASMY